MPIFSRTTITDYQQGVDVIGFQAIETAGISRFVGAASSGDLEVGDLGYHRDGEDTIIEARFRESGADEYDLLTIVLSDYTGPLAAGDFDLG